MEDFERIVVYIEFNRCLGLIALIWFSMLVHSIIIGEVNYKCEVLSYCVGRESNSRLIRLTLT